MRLVGAWYRQPYRLGAGRQQQPVVGNGLASGENDLASPGIDRYDLGLEPQIDRGLRVKIGRPQREPILRRAAGEIVL